METQSLLAPIWVDSSKLLISAIENIKLFPRIAVDTESNSLFAYKEEVCLIQISTPSMDFLFDPFVLQDLSPLGELFENPLQEKIFHASEYDLICLRRDFQFRFANIFDTMVAARILGETQVGLGSLLKNKFDIDIDKRYQRANWGIRPLSQMMLDYARLDTHYLFQLRDLLESDLIAKQLFALAQEDFCLACKEKTQNNENNPPVGWKIAGTNHIDARQAAILHELCLYRDLQAQKADLPHFKVLPNQLLLELSLVKPKTLEDLVEISGCSEKIINRHGVGLLQALSTGENAAPIIRKHTAKPDEAFLKRLEDLKEWRKTKAKELKVESDIILPKETLERIAATNPSNASELSVAMSDTPIRFNIFGKLIFKILLPKENL
ncbi:MAG: HRDC domain-containing protein [Chloroflexi bacterium]|nr:HRDC domain-containing protein [Chloroflexota bacterium]